MLLFLVVVVVVDVVKVAASEFGLEGSVEKVHQFRVLVLLRLPGGPRVGVGVVEGSLDQLRGGSRCLEIKQKPFSYLFK